MTRPVGNPWHHGQIAVLRELHRAGSASRAELAQATGLTPQSLTRIAQELIAADFIRERERRRTGGMGQPAIELGLVAARIFSVGLVLEHDQLTCVLSDVTAGPLLRKVVRGNFLSARRTLEVCQELVA
ncbi:MAG: MarR family transcriptional regulator, partial [Burkholderiales bacterium]|nr:MarR family transcriptional regulator [Burkholderiales bacterium]